MGSGDIVVGKNSPAPKSTTVNPENFANCTGAPAALRAIPGSEERHCGAMSQQCGNSGAVSTPQKFVRLVGCRDPKARPPGRQ